jgi:hypothetical protein
MCPVFRSIAQLSAGTASAPPASEWRPLPHSWRVEDRGGGGVSSSAAVGEFIELSFSYLWCLSGETAFFALYYPYSYYRGQSTLDAIDARFVDYPLSSAFKQKNDGSDPPIGSDHLPSSSNPTEHSIYYFREHLIDSVEGRRIDLLTISSSRGVREGEREDRIPGLFPCGEAVPRAHRFDGKPVRVRSACWYLWHVGELSLSSCFV